MKNLLYQILISYPRYPKINQIVCITKGNRGATILWWQQLQIIWVLVSVTIYYKCYEGSIIYAKQLFYLKQSYKLYDVAGAIVSIWIKYYQLPNISSLF